MRKNVFLQKNVFFPCLRRLGALSPDPQPPAAGGFAPRPPWPPAAGGSAPRPPKQPPPHFEFLASRLSACWSDRT